MDPSLTYCCSTTIVVSSSLPRHSTADTKDSVVPFSIQMLLLEVWEASLIMTLREVLLASLEHSNA